MAIITSHHVRAYKSQPTLRGHLAQIDAVLEKRGTDLREIGTFILEGIFCASLFIGTPFFFAMIQVLMA